MHDNLKGSLDALLQKYDDQLQHHGDTALGALWPNEEDRRTRFDVMLDVLDREKAGALTLCDLLAVRASCWLTSNDAASRTSSTSAWIDRRSRFRMRAKNFRA